MKIKNFRFQAFILTFIILFSVFSAFAYSRSDGWIYVRNSREIPEDIVAGGFEQDGRATYVCRVEYRGTYSVGRLLDGQCLYNRDGRERSANRFEVLTGRDFEWKKNGVNYDYAVIAGGNTDNKNYYVCRVEYKEGKYPGMLVDGRCFYTRDGRGFSDRNYEVLQSNRRINTLLYAASRGDYTGVRDALRDGQAINQTDSSGKTALMLASENGYERVVRELIYERAAIDIRDKSGNTAMMLAAAKGHGEIVYELVREGANFYALNDAGDSAFTLAAANGQSRLVSEFLLGNQYFKVDKFEAERGFRKAAANGHTDVLQILLNAGTSVESRADIDGKTALMEASAGRQLDAIRFLLRNDADLNAKDLQGLNAFHHAILANSDKTLRLFMEEIGIKSTDPNVEAGLRLAAYRDKREPLEYLIKQNVNLNTQGDSLGLTALMLAAGEGNEKATEMLIKAGADLNLQNRNGETALMLAAANSKNNTTKELVKAGADLNKRDNNGLTALGWAIKNDHGDTRKTLQKAGAKQ